MKLPPADGTFYYVAQVHAFTKKTRISNEYFTGAQIVQRNGRGIFWRDYAYVEYVDLTSPPLLPE